MINDDKIHKLIKEHNENDETEGNYFYGVITATIGKMMLLGTLSPIANKYYLVNVTNKKIHMFGIDMLGNPEGYSYIPMSEVENIKISNWMFGMGKKIYIQLKENKIIKLKANKFNIGVKKQKENLICLVNYFENGKATV